MTTQHTQLQFPELIDIEAVAKLLGVGERYVRRMVSKRRIPFYKIGHLLRFYEGEVLAWIAEQRQPADDATNHSTARK
jgi:excisionase family DNA binding protein